MDAIDHASWSNGIETKTTWIQAEKLEKGDMKDLEGVDGIIVPIGWGARGVEGKIKAIEYARTNKVPLFWTLLRYATCGGGVCTKCSWTSWSSHSRV